MPSYSLINAEKRAQENPDRFRIPHRTEREHLEVGDLVKLIFNDAERMWVEIRRIIPGAYEGILRNRPVTFTVEEEEIIIFRPEHVIDYIPMTGGN